MRNVSGVAISPVLLFAASATTALGAPLAQGGAQVCPFPKFEASQELADSLLGAGRLAPETKSYLLDFLLDTDNPMPADTALGIAVAEYGGPEVTAWLLVLVYASPISGLGPYVRGKAAALYGVYHRLYPQYAPAAVLPALLTNTQYPDEVREGLVKAVRYVDSEPGLSEALSLVLCQAAFHVRPFVHRPVDLWYGGPNEMHWYRSALSLLEQVVYTLVIRPGGREIIDQYLRSEANEHLVRKVREWADNPQAVPFF
jgi:hypothetical protein